MKVWFKRWIAATLLGLTLAGAYPDRVSAVPPAPVTASVGDLTTARRIAVLVPGADTTPENFATGFGGQQRRSPVWQARVLHEATGGRVAVVAWLGYDAPDGIGRGSIRSERAVAGGSALASFVATLVCDHPQATVTVIGHSYGSVVLAHAAPALPAPVTDLVVLGSPGLDVNRPGELHTTARLWVGSAGDDWTRWIPDIRIFGLGHGTNPARPWFGARALDVDGAEGHDGYFIPGTDSLRSLATVATG